jgi:hypothetical protein
LQQQSRAAAQGATPAPDTYPVGHEGMDHSAHGGNMTTGDVDTTSPGAFDPTKYLTDFDYGKVSTLPNGQTLREWDILS